MVSLALFFQALDDATGKQLLSSEVIQNQFPMYAQRPGGLLHRLEAGAHRLPAPLVEEHPGQRGRVVIPKLLKGFLDKVSAGGPQAVAEQITEPESLVAFRVVYASLAWEQWPQ